MGLLLRLMRQAKTPQFARKRARSGPRFGSHMSVAGGLENAFADGVRVGCECLQIFVKNQRQWQAPPLTEETIRRYKLAQSATELAPVVAHATYLLNFASAEKTLRDKSILCMVDELERCEALGVSSLIFHPGAHMKSTPAEGMKRVAKSLDRVHKYCQGFRSRVLLETTAGQGSALGWRFEQLAEIIDQTKSPDRVGVCLDTCHLFAAGYDFRKGEEYAGMIQEMDATFGSDRVECIHTNDSKQELGSRVDRHEHIGKGKIGKSGFSHFVNDPRFLEVPFILETAKGKDGRGSDLDTVNLKRLRSLVEIPGA